MSNSSTLLNTRSAMNEGEHILVSLEPRHADNIFSGVKKVELRRRAMNVSAGATMWIYVKVPVGSILGRAKIRAIHALPPQTLWTRFGHESGLSRNEFFAYFAGATKGFALELEKGTKLRRAVSLKELRNTVEGFQPPQFFSRLNTTHPIRDAVTRAA